MKSLSRYFPSKEVKDNTNPLMCIYKEFSKLLVYMYDEKFSVIMIYKNKYLNTALQGEAIFKSSPLIIHKKGNEEGGCLH